MGTVLMVSLGVAWLLAASEIEYFNDAGTQVVTANGSITGETPYEVVIKTNDEELKIPVFRIESIRYDRSPPELLNVRQLERQGRFDEANKELDGIVKTIDASQDEYLVRSIEYQMFENLARLALTDPAKQKEAIEWFEKQGQGLKDTRHFYPMQEMAGQLYMRVGDYAKAEEAFNKLRGVDWPGYKEKSLVYQGQAALLQGKGVEATAAFDDVINSTAEGRTATEQKQLARVGKATALVLSDKPQPAEELCRAIIEELSADEENEQILAQARNTLGDALRKLGRNKEAVLDGYMWVHVMYNSDPTEHARAVYNLASLFGEIGYPDKAQQMADLLKSTYGGSEWAKKLAGS